MARLKPAPKRYPVAATQTQTPSSNQPNPFKYSQSPALYWPIGRPKQAPKSKQPVAEGRSSSSVPKRANLPKQSISAPATAAVAKKTTTGKGAPKQVVNNQTRPPAEDFNQWYSGEIEALKVIVADHAVRLARLEKGRDQAFAPPIKDDDPGSLSPLTEDDRSEIIPKPDPLGNLLDAMRLRNKKRLYNRCRANVAIAMLQAEVPLHVDWRNQDWILVCKAAARAKELEPQLGKYVDDWATYEIIKTIAKNKRSYSVRRVRGLATGTTGKIKNDGDQAEVSGLVGEGSVRLDSATASSPEEGNDDNDGGDADDGSDMEDDDGCQVNGSGVHEDDSCKGSELSGKGDDDSEACASGTQDDEILSEINDNGSGIDEADGQGVNDSEIGGTDIKSEGAEDEGNERGLKMETDNDEGIVDVGQIPAIVTKKGLKRRLAEDSDLREDSRTALTNSKPITKRKKN